jgi:hypothetical protein
MPADILDLRERKRHLAAKRGFEPWTRRFARSFEDTTTPASLDDAVIKDLIAGDEESAAALYELAMGVLGLGAGPRFHFLESREKMAVMDLTLNLLDLFRFEAMRRLGWTEDLEALHVPIVDLIVDFASGVQPGAHRTPALSAAHPRYREFLDAFEGDRAAFVRRLIPEAIECFNSSGEDIQNP